MKEDFLLMVSEHEGIIYKICKMYCDTKEDREDLFQDIVYQLWKSHASFKKESKASTWIYRIALNVAVTRIRKQVKSKDVIDIMKSRFRYLIRLQMTTEKKNWK